jgi:hypothetical protein
MSVVNSLMASMPRRIQQLAEKEGLDYETSTLGEPIVVGKFFFDKSDVTTILLIIFDTVFSRTHWEEKLKEIRKEKCLKFWSVQLRNALK